MESFDESQFGARLHHKPLQMHFLTFKARSCFAIPVRSRFIHNLVHELDRFVVYQNKDVCGDALSNGERALELGGQL